MPGPNLTGAERQCSALGMLVFSTDRPELDLAPNSKAVNALQIIAQIPHDSQEQNWILFVPRSQMHCVLWNVRIWWGFSIAASLDLGY